jgi:uncharacterized protein (DUF58 family)
MDSAVIKLRQKILIPLWLVLLISQIIQPSKVWMVLLVGITLLGGLGYFWARSLKNGLKLTREMRFGWSQVGDHLQERFYLSNEGWAPAVWMTVWDHSDLAGYRASTVMDIGGNAVRHWFKSGVCERRGLFTIGPTSLRTGDPFGLFDVWLDYSATSNMMVMPPIVSLPAIQVAPGGRVGEGDSLARALEQTVSASGVREYQDGDSLRFVHWPTSIRRGTYYVRTFDSTPASDYWIFLDLFEGVQVGEGEQATEEHGIILAASLANRFLDSGRAVGLAAQGESLIWDTPRLEESQKWQILRSLALAEPGQKPLKELLAGARGALKYTSSLVIITPDLTGAWLDPLLLYIQRGIIPTVLLLDAPGFGGEGDLSWIQDRLYELSIKFYLIGPDFLDRAERKPALNGGQQQDTREARKMSWRPLV